MKSKNTIKDPIYRRYIQQASLPDNYRSRSIFFDADGKKNIVPYKNDRYQSVDHYRQTKSYPHKAIDKPQSEFDFRHFSAHGTTLASVISAMRYTNGQLVPGVKLRKLTGASSTSGESLGVVKLGYHFNNKSVSAFKISDKMQPIEEAGIQIAIGYSQSFLSGQENTASNVPVLVLGDGSGKSEKVGIRSDMEWAWQRLNLRLLVVDEADKADVLAVLRCLKQFDIRICSFSELETFYMKADENASLETLWQQSEAANPEIPLETYAEAADLQRQKFAEAKLQLKETTKVQETATLQKPEVVVQDNTVGTEESVLEDMQELGKALLEGLKTAEEKPNEKDESLSVNPKM